MGKLFRFAIIVAALAGGAYFALKKAVGRDDMTVKEMLSAVKARATSPVDEATAAAERMRAQSEDHLRKTEEALGK